MHLRRDRFSRATLQPARQVPNKWVFGKQEPWIRHPDIAVPYTVGGVTKQRHLWCFNLTVETTCIAAYSRTSALRLRLPGSCFSWCSLLTSHGGCDVPCMRDSVRSGQPKASEATTGQPRGSSTAASTPRATFAGSPRSSGTEEVLGSPISSAVSPAPKYGIPCKCIAMHILANRSPPNGATSP